MNLAPLTNDQQLWLDGAMARAAASVQVEAMPMPPTHLQALYDAVVEDYRDRSDLVEAVGAAFGACLKARGGLEWMLVSDDYGDEVVLAAEGHEIIASPFSMIRKRIEDGQDWDIVALCEEVHTSIRQRIEAGDIDQR